MTILVDDCADQPVSIQRLSIVPFAFYDRSHEIIPSIPPTALAYLSDINDRIRNKLVNTRPSQLLKDPLLASSKYSPLWYRGLARNPEPAVCMEVEAIKATAKVGLQFERSC